MTQTHTPSDIAHESFDDWLSRTCTAPANYSFAQYGRYVEGWRNSKPWASAGMSIAYDRWAESRWDDTPSQSALCQAWEWGLALIAKSVLHGEPSWCRHASAEECADFALTLPDTFASLVNLAKVLAEQKPELFQ